METKHVNMIKKLIVIFVSFMLMAVLVNNNGVKAQETTMTETHDYYNMYGKKAMQNSLTVFATAKQLTEQIKNDKEQAIRKILNITDLSQSVEIFGAVNATIKVGASDISYYDMGWINLTLHFQPHLSTALKQTQYAVVYEKSDGSKIQVPEGEDGATFDKDSDGSIKDVTIHKIWQETKDTRGSGSYYLVAIGKNEENNNNQSSDENTSSNNEEPHENKQSDNVIVKKIPVILKNTGTIAGYIKGTFENSQKDEKKVITQAANTLHAQDIVQAKIMKVNFDQWENDEIYQKFDEDNFTANFYVNYSLKAQSDQPKWKLVYFSDQSFENGIDITDHASIKENNGEVFYTTNYKKSGYYVLVEEGNVKAEETPVPDPVDPTDVHYWGSCSTMYENYRFFTRREETPVDSQTANSQTFKPLSYQEGRDNIAYCFNKGTATPNGQYQIENWKNYNYINYARYDMYSRSTGANAFWKSLNDNTNKSYADTNISESTYRNIAGKLGAKSIKETKNLLYEKMLYVIYNGYHGHQAGILDDPSGIQAKYHLSDTDFRKLTAALVHYYTSDDTSINGSRTIKDSLEFIYTTYQDKYGLFNKWSIIPVSHNNEITDDVKSAAQNLVNGLGVQPPADRKLYIYNWQYEYDSKNLKKVSISESIRRQNLLSAEFQQTSTYIHILKADQNGNALSGAELTVYEGTDTTNDERIIYHWTSGQTSKALSTSMFKEGQVYTIKETSVPNGYKDFGEVQFKIINQQIVITHQNDHVTVKGRQMTIHDDLEKYELIVHKKDPNGAYIKGARLRLINQGGTTIEEWTSDGSAHRISDLEEGTYILEEVTAPDGYQKAASMTIRLDGKNQKNSYDITMIDQQYKTLTVVKGWGTGTSPKEITVRLIKNGNRVLDSERSDYKIQLNESNNFTYTWKNLDDDAQYSVEEETNDDGLLPVPLQSIKTYEKITSFDSLKAGEQFVLLAKNHNNQALGIQNNKELRLVPLKNGSLGETLYSIPTDDTLWQAKDDAKIDTNFHGIKDENPTIKIVSAADNNLYITNKGSDSAFLLKGLDGQAVQNMCLYQNKLYFGGAISQKPWNMKYDGSRFYCQDPASNNTLLFDAYKVNRVESSVNGAQSIFTLENQRKELQKAELVIKKYDTANNHALSGAVFQIYSSIESGPLAIPYTHVKGKKVGQIMTTDGQGKAESEALEPNKTYYLVEETAPQGYQTIKQVIIFKVLSGKGTQIIIENNTDKDQIYSKDGILFIGNQKKEGYSLPETGGYGITSYYYAGGFFIILAVFIYFTKQTGIF